MHTETLQDPAQDPATLAESAHLTELTGGPVVPLDLKLQAQLRHKIERKTKPPGSLGQLEALALQMGLIQGSLTPTVTRPALLVFAGDHGIVAEGVSPYPQAVTAQMVGNFIAGGAAVNALSGVAGMVLEVVDAGVAADLHDAPGMIDCSLGRGTQNFAAQAAMTHAQVRQALAAGAARVRHHAALGTNVIACGEMGIGNTSAAACLMSCLCAVPLADCVGRGTGLDDAGLAHKHAVLAAALAYHHEALQRLEPADPLAALAVFGGFEIAMMAGAFLGAAAQRLTIVVDGFIAGAALLAAARIAPAVLDYCVFAHQSGEAGHARLLAHFKAQPLLSLGLRLGEGTGAALALPLLRAACAFMTQMASFDAAGVSDRAPQ
jgi:nicotinate-nucleotide--dimethylbenzimidazole phosphoribosyltransferase